MSAAAALSVPRKMRVYTGTPFNLEGEGQTTPGVQQVLIDVEVDSDRLLLQAILICRMESKFVVLVDGVLKGSGRTGAANPNAYMSWQPGLPVTSGQRIELRFTQRPNSPSVDVEGYLQGSI